MKLGMSRVLILSAVSAAKMSEFQKKSTMADVRRDENR